MQLTTLQSITLLTFMAVLLSCEKSNNATSTEALTKEVDPTLFIRTSLDADITKVDKVLSNGSTVSCYKIVTNKNITDHAVGPWCPTNLSDGADKGGIWLEGGKVYDVDGNFVKNLSTFYNDAKWKLYHDDGTIKVTNTKASCEAAARPDVDPSYNNYCVECQPSYFPLKITYYLPVKPIKLSSSSRINAMGAVVGIAFNGINFDPPAPTQAILGAHTLAPFDDAGGHVNHAVGYHYHAATGKSKSVKQADGHAPLIGYALDGFGLYALLDEAGKEATDLDECRGHSDDTRGYHYHVATAGSNSFIGCFYGVQGIVEANTP